MKQQAAGRDFTQGRMWENVLSQAIPLTLAQLVQLLYNVVDRIYIGHMGDGSGLALTGVGLAFPFVTLIMAFTALFGMGCAPLFSIARGQKNEKDHSTFDGVSAVRFRTRKRCFCRGRNSCKRRRKEVRDIGRLQGHVFRRAF